MNDEDFEQFITLLDAAIASDDPKIQKALKKFVFLIRLNLSDEDCKPGPFTKMMETIDDLQRRVGQVENRPTQQPYYGGSSPTIGGGTSVDPFTHWYNNGTNITYTNAVSTTTTPTTTTITNPSSNNITLGGSTCTGFIANAYAGNTTTTYTMFEEDSGTSIKDDIKEKLAKLVKVA